MSEGAAVSVVIPTCGRSRQVAAAVKSALAQSYAPFEVIVVIDGFDPETISVLGTFGDQRLRLITLEKNVGGAEARNIGIRSACGEWIAFLDDDDTWMPEKLKRQMEVAASVSALFPIVSSKLLDLRAGMTRMLPYRLYEKGEDVSEYLLCRRGLGYGGGMLQTSTLLTKRDLLLDLPFLKGLKLHQDWDWLIKAARRPDVEIAMAPEALTVMYVDEQSGSVSQSTDWKASLEWAQEARSVMSRRAYSFFIATECVSRARKNGAGVKVVCELLRTYFQDGHPSARSLVLFLGFLLFSRRHRNIRKRRSRKSFLTGKTEMMTGYD